MNTYSTIPLTFIRDQVKDFYDITDTKKDATIDLYIMKSVNEMKSYLNVKGCCVTLDICDNKAAIPCNFKRLIQLVSDHQDELGQHYVYDNFTFDGHSIWTSNTKRFKIEDGYIIFPSDIEATQVDMYYLGYITDDNGFPILRKSHEPYYFRYVGYWFGAKIKDSRYKMFDNYRAVRKNTIHNENVEDALYNMSNIAAIKYFEYMPRLFSFGLVYQSPYSGND